MRGFHRRLGRLALSAAAISGAWADTPPARQDRTADLYNGEVRRFYRNTSRYLIDDHAIVLAGNTGQVMRLSRWLDEIVQVPTGLDTLRTILQSGNELTIRHSTWALQPSGRTLAPVSADLTNGRGADIVILFDARIPDQGSHRVEDRHGRPLAFTAVQNLFHELAHAKHMVQGTWRYWDSEGQAIAAENRFRQAQAALRGELTPPLRSGIDGAQIWWPQRRVQHISDAR